MTETNKNTIKTLIIGSGPAGLSAALYAARANLEPLVLSGMELGGQVSVTHIVENYPGFPDGIEGPKLVENFQKQAERFGARLEFDSATEVDLSNRPFRVKTWGSEYLAETLILATGATPSHLDIPGETEFTGRGVSYCATCDGHFFQGKDVVVVGGGDSALEEGLFLTRYVNSVKIIHRRDELRAGAILQKRAFDNPKVEIIWDTVITEIKGDGTVDTPTDGVFIFIGHIPNTDLYQGQLELDVNGYVQADQYMQTSVPGVYAAGEVADSHFRQVVTSAGMGAGAAMQAIHFLEEHPEESIKIDMTQK